MLSPLVLYCMIDTPENVEAWQGIATCLHSIVGWWADQDADEENDDEDEDEEEPEDELSLPVYSTERGLMSLQGTTRDISTVFITVKSVMQHLSFSYFHIIVHVSSMGYLS